MDSAEHSDSLTEMVTRSVAIKSFGLESRTIDVIASTDRVDSYKEIVQQDSWNLDRVKSIGVPVFYNHQSKGLPIGKVVHADVIGGRLEATLQLTTEDINPEAEKVWRAVKGGLIGAVSVGFVPGDYGMQDRDGQKVLTLSNSELVEISLTPTPANSDAAIMRLRSKAIARNQVNMDPIPQAPSEPEVSPGDTSMKNLLNELGLTDADGEEQAMNILKALRARVANHDEVLEFLGLAGCEDGEQVLAVVNAHKQAAELVPGLEAQIETLTKDAERAQREMLVGQIMAAKKATPHQRDHYLPTLSIPSLRLFLETATRIPALGGKVEEPAKELSASKKWAEMSYKDKARLYQDDKAAYDALKAAAGE